MVQIQCFDAHILVTPRSRANVTLVGGAAKISAYMV